MPSRSQPSYRTWVTYLQVGLALVAATVLGWRTVRTLSGQSAPQSGVLTHLGAGATVGAATAIVVTAAVLLHAGRRRSAAAALSASLVLELVVLSWLAAPPRLVTALPLGLALALFLVDRDLATEVRMQDADAAPGGRARTASAVVSLLLMAPVGFLYLLSGLVVPAPALYGMYVLYAVLLGGAALLARQRSWWVLAVPALSTGLWFLSISLGARYLGWQA